MTSRQQNIAIALLAGWKYGISHNNPVYAALVGPDGIRRSSQHLHLASDEWFASMTPKYSVSMEYMRKALETLTDDEWTRYIKNLARVIAGVRPEQKMGRRIISTRRLLMATPMEQAKAFLMTKQAWRDTIEGPIITPPTEVLPES